MSLRYSAGRIFLACFLLSFVTLQLTYAQTGTVKGKVIDKTTKEELPGANIVVKGTSLGAVSSPSGVFNLYKVPAGDQTLLVSYIGYISTSVVVNVNEGETTVRDIALTATTLEGEEVVVTAQARGQMQAINQQLASNKIANIVSEARIQELPDFNAAQAISRLPGVSTLSSSGEANKVVIRGLAPQFNIISISNISLSPTGSTQIGFTSLSGGSINQDRSVDLTMVTPYMIKSIAVYKTLTPDMNANAIGGLVNMELREAPPGFHTELMWQSGYTNKTKEYGNYRAILSASDRFLDGLLGVYVLGNAEQYDRASDNMNGNYEPNGTVIGSNGYVPARIVDVALQRHIETRKRYGVNAILDYALPHGMLRSINMFSRLNSNVNDYQTSLNYKSGNIDFSFRRSKTETDLAINILEFENDFDFMLLNLKVANTYSRNHLPSSQYYQFRETNGISTTGVNYDNVLPEDMLWSIKHTRDRDIYLNTISLFEADYKANDQVYKADLKFPLALGSDFSGFIKVGGEYRYNNRENDQSTPYLQPTSGPGVISRAVIDSIRARFGIEYDAGKGMFPASNFTSSDGELIGSFLDNKFGGVLWINDPRIIDAILDYTRSDPRFNASEAGATNPGGWYDGAFQHLPNDYKYIEKYYAGYAMAELGLGPDLRVVGGARYEQVRSLYDTYNLRDGRNLLSQEVYPVQVHPENHFWLPMVQAKYNIFDWLDVRYAYTQTLARPDYHQLSPHITMSFDRRQVTAGNPRLKPAQSYNHDLQFTFHSNDLGLISVGAFYKTVSRFTYFTTYRLYKRSATIQIPEGLDSVGSYSIGGMNPENGATLNTYINSPYDAYVKGIEADIQLRFWYLPAPFDGMVFGMNYTHIWSKATYPWRDERSYLIPPRTIGSKLIDSTRTGRLIFQPDDVLNAYIGYDYEGFSTRLTLVFQGNSVSRIGAFDVQDGFTRDYFRVDASARQILPWAGLQLFIDVNNINARRNQSSQVSFGGFTNEQNYGLTANLGVRFTL
ncbi:MAG: TonB-dependent receptor [Ignavibacteriae bacterium]|nr:TonB-dependent receptor [Ignavibacteriota bacterium]